MDKENMEKSSISINHKNDNKNYKLLQNFSSGITKNSIFCFYKLCFLTQIRVSASSKQLLKHTICCWNAQRVAETAQTTSLLQNTVTLFSCCFLCSAFFSAFFYFSYILLTSKKGLDLYVKNIFDFKQ